MATEYGGYMGKILRIDLTTETAEEYPFTDQQRREILGGKTLAYRILSDLLTGKERAFSAENLLIFSTGPLTGTGIPGSGRFEITTISPKTALPVSSNCGGDFGVFLKKAGYDALLLHGRCQRHRWLEISEAAIRFQDACDLWGADATNCFQYLTQRNPNHPFGYLCIGPAGEALLPSATIVSGGRSMGKSGFGAVLGWKNLKAITVSGSKTIPISDPIRTAEELKSWNCHIRQNPLTSDPQKISSCPGCAIRCKSRGAEPDPILTALGLDAQDAPQYTQWLHKMLGYIPEFPASRKHGKRRNELYQAMLQLLALPDCESSFAFYQNLSEAIGALGLCLFTVSASFTELSAEIPSEPMPDDYPGPSSIYPSRLLQYATGLDSSLGQLLAIGAQSRRLQNQLHQSFQSQNGQTFK